MALLVPPELLLTDVAMPGMGGVELAIAVQKAVPDCRVLLLGAGGFQQALNRCPTSRTQTDSTVLAKPVHRDVLLAETSRLFGQS